MSEFALLWLPAAVSAQRTPRRHSRRRQRERCVRQPPRRRHPLDDNHLLSTLVVRAPQIEQRCRQLRDARPKWSSDTACGDSGRR